MGKTKHYHGENAAKRRESLFRFLLSRGDRWTSMEQVTDSVTEYPAFFTGYYHNSRTRRMLTDDIEAINGDPRFSKVIISGSFGVKLAKKDEFNGFLESELREVFRKLRRLRRIAAKASHDQQIDIEGRIAEAFLYGEE